MLHAFDVGDARDLADVAGESIHLVVTSPPYWSLKKYPDGTGQLSAIEDYEAFLAELNEAWKECVRALVPGGRICCVVSDVCVPQVRKTFGDASSRRYPSPGAGSGA